MSIPNHPDQDDKPTATKKPINVVGAVVVAAIVVVVIVMIVLHVTGIAPHQ